MVTGKKLNQDESKLIGALRVIRTWAAFDIDEGRQTALTPEDVMKICDKALEGYPGDSDD